MYFAGAHKEVRPFYQDAKLTLICSLKEGLSLTSYESCAMGIPVVTSDVGGQKDLIDSSVGALIPCLQNEYEDFDVRTFPEEEIQAYVQAIVDILSNAEKWQSMSNACRMRIENAFTIKKMVQHFENEFIRLITDESLRKERDDKASALHILSPLAEDYLTVELQEQAAEENHGFYYFKAVDYKNNDTFNANERLYWLETQCKNISNQLANHEEVLNRHEEVVNRHEEVVNRHEEVVNRHEEVVNRHERVVNDDWAWLKSLTYRIENLEQNSAKKILNKLIKFGQPNSKGGS